MRGHWRVYDKGCERIDDKMYEKMCERICVGITNLGASHEEIRDTIGRGSALPPPR